jgi:tRNA (guanine37-N1)-methyltransferase
MRFDIITIFPDFFAGPFDYGVLKRARNSGLVEIATHDLRSFTHDRHRTVDDRPFGGGEGMVLKAQPIYDAVTSLNISPKAERERGKETVILLSAQGQPFTQPVAQELAMTERVVILCGRYEGVDERVNQLLCDREISIGDYVLSGGELAAAVIVDAVVRLLPGVLGNPDSSRFESFGADDVVEDAAGAGASAVDLWFGWATGLSALHAAGGFYGGHDSGCALERKPRGGAAVAAADGAREDTEEPAGFAG